MEEERIRVGILGEERLLLESLVALLEGEGLRVVSCCAQREDFLLRTQQSPPDVALVDLRLEPSAESTSGGGLRVVELLHDFHPEVRALVLSSDGGAVWAERCLQAGAFGYLCTRYAGPAELVAAVERVARGERLVLSGLLPQPLWGVEATPARGVLGRLTAREREVLGYIAAGADNLKIAACLGITERTVKAHITSIYRKLDVENRTQMAMLACQLGIERPAHI